MAGRIIGILITGGIGIVFCVLGWLIWKREKIYLMHSYHIDKVSKENKSTFCKMSGIGIIIIGIGLFVTAVILGHTDSAYSFICFSICFFIGLSILIIAGIKYNR